MYYICDFDETEKLINESFGITVPDLSNKITVYGEGSTARALKVFY